MRAVRLGFRNWRRSRPFWAGVWTILGGALVAYVPSTAFKLVFISNGSVVIGIGVGVAIGIFGLMLWFIRPLHVLLGFLILVLSLISFFTSDFGGFLLGMLMGLVGGSLAVAWVPTKVTRRERRQARKLAVAGAATAEDAMPVEASAMTAEADSERTDEVATPDWDGLVEELLTDREPEPSGEGASAVPDRRST